MIGKIKITLDKGAFSPVRAHHTDAGVDLLTPRPVYIGPHGEATIDTGVHVAIPAGYWGKIESKSGLNVKHSIVSLGGTIDSGYTGSIRVKLYNISSRPYAFKAGEKVAQLVIGPCETPELVVVDSLEATERGDGGFGSTGR